MSIDLFASVHAGRALPRAAVPTLDLERFRGGLVEGLNDDHRAVALFGHVEDGALALYAVLADSARGLLRVARTVADGDRYPSLTPACPQLHLFERELAEQYGVRPEGHPWFKPVRFHASYRSGRDAWGRGGEVPLIGVTDYFRVEGEEVHEVAVGPVHAGIIEPGHFRFQCHGEQVFHLEISLGYQHRGVERAMVGAPHRRALFIMEALAGDTSIGHATAYAQALEGLACSPAPVRAEVVRGIALELERLANHTGDLGALAGDVAFLPTASYCGRLRGDFLNLTALLCGSRFGRGLVRPGGVGFDVEPDRRALFCDRLEAAFVDVEEAVGLLFDSASVQARFEDTGAVRLDDAVALGLVGPAARACGVETDTRQDFPSGIFRFAQVPASTWHTGDVFARACVRWLEIQRSVEFIRTQLRQFPEGPLTVPVAAPEPDHFVVALVEGWRGQIAHIGLTDGQGRLERYKVVDPSFRNWTGLAMALRDEQISDFPLCNKSFNLSYCGYDL